MATIKELENQILELQKELKKIKEEKFYKRRRAEEGEGYYFINLEGVIEKDEELKDTLDDNLYNFGNYYKTKEEAEKAKDKQLAIVRVNDRIRELNWDFKTNEEVKRHRIYFLENDYCVISNCFSNHVVFGTTINYCKSKKIAEQIIYEMKDDLDLIFNLK